MSLLTAGVILGIVGALVCLALQLRLQAPPRGDRGTARIVAVLAAAAILGFALLARDCRHSNACAPAPAYSATAALGSGAAR